MVRSVESNRTFYGILILFLAAMCLYLYWTQQQRNNFLRDHAELKEKRDQLTHDRDRRQYLHQLVLNQTDEVIRAEHNLAAMIQNCQSLDELGIPRSLFVAHSHSVQDSDLIQGSLLLPDGQHVLKVVTTVLEKQTASSFLPTRHEFFARVGSGGQLLRLSPNDNKSMKLDIVDGIDSQTFTIPVVPRPAIRRAAQPLNWSFPNQTSLSEQSVLNLLQASTSADVLLFDWLLADNESKVTVQVYLNSTGSAKYSAREFWKWFTDSGLPLAGQLTLHQDGYFQFEPPIDDGSSQIP